MNNFSILFLVIVLSGILAIALILIVKIIIAEIRKPSNEQLVLFGLLAILVVFLISFILGLIQIL
ncbi:MAG: hypothetical protein EAX91_15845 [Candidatus Lokiarchaeota archaeon]|nr:hypothetical protein [Candidatus Lokiarchaeota archaeon]